MKNPSKPTQTVLVRVRTCNCTEVGISEKGILMALLRRLHPHANLVERCEHWSESYIRANDKVKSKLAKKGEQ